MRRSGLAPVAAQLAVPVALGLLIGGVLAYQAGSSNNAVIPVPLGAVPTPTAAFLNPAVATPASNPSPGFLTPSASTTTPVVTKTATVHASGR
jgi:hypothetical protein